MSCENRILFVYFVLSYDYDHELDSGADEIQYEYLDHPADVQIHSWGDTLEKCFEQAGVAMYGYMTDANTISIHRKKRIEASGHDMDTLLYAFLNELLYQFSAEDNFIGKKIRIRSFDRENFSLTADVYGEEFDLTKHPQGTEVKAITYSNMQIHENDATAGSNGAKCNVFVIIDI